LKRLLLSALVLSAGALMTAGPASAAEPEFRWLCKPGLAENPCTGSLATTEVSNVGQEIVTKPKRAKKPPVDCFYVYPTVSGQQTPNADLSIEPTQIAVARQQAAIFSGNCRVFAPVYPQFTVAAIFSGQLTPEVIDKAYAGVKAAWNEYLKKYNHGRGIVLIGHSQGTGHLGHLIENTFDRRPNLRKRLVSAVLMGGNIYVKKGKRVGGQFMHVPACVKAAETGCVIASSGFLKDPPPEGSLFGRVTGALVKPGLDPDKFEIMCVNAASLDGSGGVMNSLYSTPRDPETGAPNGYDTPFYSFPIQYSAKCVRKDGAHYLQVTDLAPEDPRPKISEPLGRAWGTHLTEVSDSGGNLVAVVRRQTAAYVKKVRLAKKKKKSQRKPK